MGNILAFRPRKPSADTAPRQHAVSASVVIFPGVRYERQHSAEESLKRAAACGSSQRQPQPLSTS